MHRILIPDAVHVEPPLESDLAAPDCAVEMHQWAPGVESVIPDSAWKGCDALVLFEKLQIDEAIAAKLERCRIIVRAGVGFDNVDLKGWGARGIPVCNTPDYGTRDVADQAIAHLLALVRGITHHDHRLRLDPIGEWQFSTPPLMRRLWDQAYGVVGLGRIGMTAAMRAKAFGMKVSFYDPYLPSGAELPLGLGRAETLEDLMRSSDILSLHVPLNPESHNMINRTTLAFAKPDLILINTARGPVVNIDDLYEALREGRIAGAALDVLPIEPPELDHPLIKAWRNREPWLDGRLHLTPHSAFFSPSSIIDLRTKAIVTALNFLRSGKIRNCVNRRYLAS